MLTVLPHVVDRAPGTVDIVFDGRPGSRLWRDLLIHLMGRVPQIAGITFLGFYDLVSGMPHQGSLSES